jgi:integrase
MRRQAEETFRTKRAAEQWLASVETELLRGQWISPDAQAILLSDFGRDWIAQRPGLRPRTVDLYRSLFRLHIEPQLGNRSLADLDPALIRRWRGDLLGRGVSATMAAKAYRLLRAVLMTAADDRLIASNPCRIRGAGSEHAPERPVLSVDQVLALADLMPKRYRCLIVVVTFGSLRWGEAIALRRGDVDIGAGLLRVRSAISRSYSGAVVRGAPKSRAGVRTVAIPRPVVVQLQTHLAEFCGPDPESLIFTGDKGGVIQRNNFNRRVGWSRAVDQVGVPGLHFHDLRHTGNTLAASTGATLRDLMERMGHDSIRAALIYQHATAAGDRRIADAIEGLIVDASADRSDEQRAGFEKGSAAGSAAG